MPSTNKTPNYQLSQFTDTDKAKWGVDYNADMAAIDETLKQNADNQAAHKADTNAHMTRLSCTKDGTVYKLMGTAANGQIVTFKAPEVYTAGDTFTVNGITYTAQTLNGKSLPDGFFSKYNVCLIHLRGDNVLIFIQLLPTAAQVGASNPNQLINGDFRVNQRGLEQYEDGYGFDHWENVFLNTNIISQATRSLYNGSGGKYFIHLAITSVTNSDWNNFLQRIEDSANGMSPLAGHTVTFAINANTSANCAYRCVYIAYKESPSASNVTLKTTAIPVIGGNRYSVTVALPITACRVECGIGVTRNIEVSEVNSYIDFWDCKLELGSVATPFSPRPYAEELALCQRYYRTISRGTLAQVVTSTANSVVLRCNFDTEMRIVPTVEILSQVIFTYTGGWIAESENLAVIGTNITKKGIGYIHLSGVPLTGFEQEFLLTAATDDFIGLNAEIY